MATRLGNALLKLADKPSTTAHQAANARAKVVALDRTINSLGLKGSRIKTTGAWRSCLQAYKAITGKDYGA